MDIENLNIPIPVTRMDSYDYCEIVGGDIDSLPKPVTRKEKYAYAKLVTGGGVSSGTNTTPKKYIKAILNSDSAQKNYAGVIYDLGETKKVTNAKVTFRFTLRNTGTDKPSSIGTRLFANNDPGRDVIAGYSLEHNDRVTNIEYDKEYTIETEYSATSGVNNLNTCRYLKPFVVLNKATQGKDKTHGIDIHEVTIEIEGEKYDITKTVQDFAPQGASKVEIVEESISKPQTIQTTSAKTTATLPFAGKVLDFIGDSNVFGLDPNNGGNLRKKVAKPYVEQLKELCGFAEVNNYGISSSTLATKSSDPAWNNARNPVCIRYADMKPADVIGFAIGINDFWLGVSLGTFNPDDTNTDTFYGALNVFLKGLITKFPKAAIFGFTMIDYKDKTRGYGANSAGYTLEQLREAIRTGCRYYNIPVLEGPEIGFSTKVEAQRNLLMPDDLHYTQEAHNIIARKSGKFINYNL